MHELFRKFATSAALALGTSHAFLLAGMVVAIWAASGPFFHFSDTWQLVINTGTTIVTFLMVFLIQATQNRDSKALHLKLDELIRAMAKARTGLVGLETMSEEDLLKLEVEFKQIRLRQEQRAARRSGRLEKAGSTQ